MSDSYDNFPLARANDFPGKRERNPQEITVETPAHDIAARFCHGNEEAAHHIRVVIRQAIWAERVRCAKIIEDGQETFSNSAGGERGFLTPRSKGNTAGLQYAAAIRNQPA